MLRKPLSLSSAGDTIIEALMAITVLGLVIMSGFSISNYSLRIVRSAQERGEGVKVVETQAERLRAAASDSANPALWNTIKAQTSDFCIVSNSVRAVASGLCKFGSNSQYDVAISYVAASSTFTIANTWDSITSSGKDNVHIVYRVRQ